MTNQQGNFPTFDNMRLAKNERQSKNPTLFANNCGFETTERRKPKTLG